MPPEQPQAEETQTCRCCQKDFLISGGSISFGPDPYDADINDDDTAVWECEECREWRSGDR